MPVNPSDRSCFSLCGSCFKCSNKWTRPQCNSCSGRHDPGAVQKFDPHDRQSFCDCRNGVLRHRTQDGRLIIKQFLTNPFKGKVKTDAESQDERDWNQWIAERREALNDEFYDPVQFDDGSSTTDWTAQARQGGFKVL